MELIPVVDLARGVAVHARAGERTRYGPVASVLTPGVAGDPLALVQAYRDTLGARECYVADLDAIRGGAVQRDLLSELARVFAGEMLVDAGISSAGTALEILELGAGRIVVGLETLRRIDDLVAIIAAAGPERVVFSLDLRLGRPVLHPAAAGPSASASDPTSLAAGAVAAGARTLLLLDVGRVGSGQGIDLELLSALRRRFSTERLLAGGGVGGRGELAPIRETGCDGLLLATALHEGRLGRADMRRPTTPAQAQSSASTSR
jgi:phosphoribosylformimino-5-aminoimidazole carboxamide ribotide isomerase